MVSFGSFLTVVTTLVITQGSRSIARMGTLVRRHRKDGSLDYTARIQIHRQD